MSNVQTQAVPKDFEAALRELEEIVQQAEGGKLSLADSLVKYERGAFLVRHCRGVLADAEKRIESITRGPDGTVAAKPMKDAE